MNEILKMYVQNNLEKSNYYKYVVHLHPNRIYIVFYSHLDLMHWCNKFLNYMILI